MIAFLRLVSRPLTGPLGRRSVALLLLAGLWAWWRWGPVRPSVDWRLPRDEVNDLRLTPDGTLAIGRTGERLRVWDLANRQERGPGIELAGTPGWIRIAPGEHLLTTDASDGLWVWKLSTG